MERAVVSTERADNSAGPLYELHFNVDWVFYSDSGDLGIWTGPGDFDVNFGVSGVQDPRHCIRLVGASNLPH